MDQEIDNSHIFVHKSAIDTTTLDSLVKMLGNDQAMFIKIVKCYLSESTQLVAEISNYVNTQDSEMLQQTAHKLKSSSAAMGAINLTQLCLEMEKIGTSGNFAESLEKLSLLTQEFEKVEIALQEKI